MAIRTASAEDFERAAALLGVAPDADEAALRAAYVEQVRLHPPDREPERFEQVRDAYELLRDPQNRAAQVLASPDPAALPRHLFDGRGAARRFAGPGPWLDVIKEKRP